jgi:hypothetical protein
VASFEPSLEFRTVDRIRLFPFSKVDNYRLPPDRGVAAPGRLAGQPQAGRADLATAGVEAGLAEGKDLAPALTDIMWQGPWAR